MKDFRSGPVAVLAVMRLPALCALFFITAPQQLRAQLRLSLTPQVGLVRPVLNAEYTVFSPFALDIGIEERPLSPLSGTLAASLDVEWLNSGTAVFFDLSLHREEYEYTVRDGAGPACAGCPISGSTFVEANYRSFSLGLRQRLVRYRDWTLVGLVGLRRQKGPKKPRRSNQSATLSEPVNQALNGIPLLFDQTRTGMVTIGAELQYRKWALQFSYSDMIIQESHLLSFNTAAESYLAESDLGVVRLTLGYRFNLWTVGLGVPSGASKPGTLFP